ncbi:unnamed protein product [Heligmosomoides polygyrus]|uniref:DNL-type domain-containing protein n=1 Tax=Heligmosomoides polygyrus TaxID=6339 RepID=A0A183FFE6_HELPZ|nr:unnamed protein product [Heligmosomoides polygyrus]
MNYGSPRGPLRPAARDNSSAPRFHYIGSVCAHCGGMRFIKDALSTQQRDCVRKAEPDDLARVVERVYRPACTVGKAAVVLGTVYLITCSRCNEEYIGETGTSLFVRVKERVAGLKSADLRAFVGTQATKSEWCTGWDSGDDPAAWV